MERLCSSDNDDLQQRRPFNVSSRRFSTPAACINTCPGPGLYTSDASTCWQYGSLGSKGFGAMCSSSKRLAARLQYTGPGPAAYSPKEVGSRRSATARPAAQAAHTPGGPAAAGHSSGSSGSSPAPPPGAYDCSVTRNGEAVAWSAKPGAGAAFKASARQPAPHRARPPQLPALQQQLLQEQRAAPAAARALDQYRQRRQRSRAAASATAAAPASRARLTSAQLAHRISTAVQGGRSSSAPPRGSRCVFDAAARAAAAVPAVGSYDVVSVGAISSSVQRRLAEGRCSPMFARPLLPSRGPAHMGRQHRQQQQPTASQNSAPQQRRGSATVEQLQSCNRSDAIAQRAPRYQQSTRMPGVGAPFKSTSPSHPAAVPLASDAALAGAPGPAFYRPDLLPVKTSHRRATRPEAAAAFLAAV